MIPRISVNRSLPVPIGVQVIGQKECGIASGALKTGTRLPSVRDLAAAEGVAHVTVSHVYRALKRDGLIAAGAHGAHPGKGKAELYWLVDAMVTRAVLSDMEHVRAVLAQADAVVSASGSEAIRADVPEGKPASEYLHTPQPWSVEAVRALIERLSGLWPHANGHRRCT